MPPAKTRPRVHVHVPYAEFDRYLPTLKEHRLSVELYLNTTSVDGITFDALKSLKKAMPWMHTLSVHAPFMDLCPGAIDSKVAAASLSRYLQVMDFCRVLMPECVVFHAGYESWKYAGNVELWLTQSLRTWREVIMRAEETGVKVAIENIVDAEPGHLKLLAERMDHPLFGLCLDVGHREIFSKLPVEDWVDGMSPYIFELHLHDNTGVNDDHLPIGEGRVDFPSLFKKLAETGINPIYTLETHTPEDALKSVEALGRFLLPAS